MPFQFCSSWYVRHFSHFGLLYGSLGTLLILMFFYLSGAAILVGGGINAILEDAAAKHKVPGVKSAASVR